LLLKFAIGKDANIGKFIGRSILDIHGITRSYATRTFKGILIQPLPARQEAAGTKPMEETCNP
jgi:hypothetical protein